MPVIPVLVRKENSWGSLPVKSGNFRFGKRFHLKIYGEEQLRKKLKFDLWPIHTCAYAHTYAQVDTLHTHTHTGALAYT